MDHPDSARSRRRPPELSAEVRERASWGLNPSVYARLHRVQGFAEPSGHERHCEGGAPLVTQEKWAAFVHSKFVRAI